MAASHRDGGDVSESSLSSEDELVENSNQQNHLQVQLQRSAWKSRSFRRASHAVSVQNTENTEKKQEHWPPSSWTNMLNFIVWKTFR